MMKVGDTVYYHGVIEAEVVEVMQVDRSARLPGILLDPDYWYDFECIEEAEG